MSRAVISVISRFWFNKANRTFTWLVMFNYLQAGLGFVINLWLARKLGPEQYGLFSYGLVIGAFVTVLVGFASDKTLVRDLVQSRDPSAILSASILLRVPLGVFACIAFAAYFSFASDAMASKSWAVMLCVSAAALHGLVPTGWYDHRYEMHVQSSMTLFEKLLFGLLLFASFIHYASLFNALTAAACLLTAACVGGLMQWWKVTHTFEFSLTAGMRELPWLTRSNLLVLLAALSNLLLTHVNQLVVESRHGLASLAYFAVALQTVAVVQIFQGQLSRFFSPKIAQLTAPGVPANEIRHGLVRFWCMALAASALMTIPIAIMAPLLIGWLFGHNYEAASSAVRILCVWCLIYGPALIVNQFLLSFRLNAHYLSVTIITGLLAVFLGQVLIPDHGILGAALALLISHSFSIGCQALIVWSRLRTIDQAEAVATR